MDFEWFVPVQLPIYQPWPSSGYDAQTAETPRQRREPWTGVGFTNTFGELVSRHHFLTREINGY